MLVYQKQWFSFRIIKFFISRPQNNDEIIAITVWQIDFNIIEIRPTMKWS